MSCCTPKSNRGDQAKNDQYRQNIRDAYTKVAQADDSDQGCCVDSSCCVEPDDITINTLISKRMGYSDDELNDVPAGADMGLGCGNPRAIASLRAGEVVVDLGAGGGFDCFLSAREVGKTGYVIGVDMTPDMVTKARGNAEKGKYSNVEFRLGEIEHLPIADSKADVVISNCVINLSPDKPQVFREAFRVLKPGGRLAISDVVATVELPNELRSDVALVAGCMGNASLIEDLETMIKEAGFTDVRIEPKDESKTFMRDWTPDRKVLDYVVSATIEGTKSANDSCC